MTNATDIQYLTRELDKAKSGVFLDKSAAFLGSLMCSMNFCWDKGVKTAATDGVNLYWNPDWFLSLTPETRKTVLVHELWHPARLHFLRQGTRDAKIWNYATDIRINNDLTSEGYSFEGIENCWRDPKYPPGTPEEDIYDDLVLNQPPPPQGCWGQPPTPCNGGNGPVGSQQIPDDGGDMLPQAKQDLARAINNVVRAIHQAKLSGGAGTIPGDVEQILTQFLAPVVPWESLLHQFMRDLIEEAYSWRRPNRRFADIYLPSRYDDEGKLDHLIYYEDVSGSISDADVVRFNSEVKYVKETYQPKLMTLVQFDTRITQELEIKESDTFDQVKLVGRGGTSLVPVREHILKHRPTAAIVFSDLDCPAMAPLGIELPIIWICISNHKATVPFGKLVHIR